VTTFGYTCMGEQTAPLDLVEHAVAAEAAGFEVAVFSDHFHPWLDEQGQSPFTWSVLGAVAARTERMRLMTMVTCPIGRYHPAIVAQAAATIQILSNGRFTLGLGAGELLNEHVVGGRWASAHERHDQLEEAIEIIRRSSSPSRSMRRAGGTDGSWCSSSTTATSARSRGSSG